MSTVIQDDAAKIVFAENMRIRMEKLNISQADLSRLTGESEMRINHYRRGLRLPTVAVAARIAEALRTKVDTLLKSQVTCREN